MADCRIVPGEPDTGGFPDQIACSVALNEIFRPKRLALRQRDIDAGAVLRETRYCASAIDGDRQLADPRGEDALDVVPPQREPVVVLCAKSLFSKRSRRNPRSGHLALHEEPIRDCGAPIILRMDAAAMHAAGHAFYPTANGA